MDCRAVLMCCIAVMLVLLVATGEGRKKKVVIHVPYKMKKIKHTHTVYKTIHHHHTHHEPPLHLLPANEEHEHFHHLHLHEERAPAGQHSVAVPDFLPADMAMGLPLELPDLPLDIAPLPNRHMIPLYRRL